MSEIGTRDAIERNRELFECMGIGPSLVTVAVCAK